MICSSIFVANGLEWALSFETFEAFHLLSDAASLIGMGTQKGFSAIGLSGFDVRAVDGLSFL